MQGGSRVHATPNAFHAAFRNGDTPTLTDPETTIRLVRSRRGD